MTAHLITKELLERVEKYPERYQIIEQNPLERLLNSNQTSYVFNKELAGKSGNKHLVILDTETTGLNPSVDEIIELAFVVVTYSPDYQLVSLDTMFDKFEEPSKPITVNTTKLTGITQEMVSGQKLSIDDIETYLPSEYTIVAHNAGFDRKFVDKRFPDLAHKPWADSLTEIPWVNKGFSKTSLEMIMYQLGFFYTAHRAINDVLALLFAIVKSDSLADLIISSTKSSLSVNIKVDYEDKEIVKNFGFKWNKDDKAWSRFYATLDEWKQDKEVLSSRCKYFALLECQIITAKERYATHEKRI